LQEWPLLLQHQRPAFKATYKSYSILGTGTRADGYRFQNGYFRNVKIIFLALCEMLNYITLNNAQKGKGWTI
jgi:hypothetical protein